MPRRAKAPEISSVLEPLLPDFFAGWVGAKLEANGLPISLAELPKPSVIVIDDRDFANELPRGRRFDRPTLTACLRNARSITMALYAPSRIRLGDGKLDGGHRRALQRSLAAGSPAVFVRTTSDRVRFWIGEAREHATAETVIRMLDSHGSCLIVQEGRW